MSLRDQKVLAAYSAAIIKVKELCKTETPIRKNDFCIENKLNKSYFWQILLELKVVNPIVSQHGEGTIFEWTYKQAFNEPDSFLANRVISCLADKYEQNKKKYRSEVGKTFSRLVPVSTSTPYVTPVVASVEDSSKEDTPEKALRKLLHHYQQEEIRLRSERDGLLKELELNENSLTNVTEFKAQLERQLGL